MFNSRTPRQILGHADAKAVLGPGANQNSEAIPEPNLGLFSLGRFTSTVKFYDMKKCWGFIDESPKRPGANPRDLFFHGSWLEKIGLKDIPSGTKVSYSTKLDHRGRMQAVHIELV